jgi:Spy/CpxP family protein refolding chaperone
MVKVKLVVIVGFLLAFGAGLVVGLSGARRLAGATTDTPAASPTTRRGFAGLVAALHLTPEQAKQIEQLRAKTMTEVTHERDDRSAAIHKQRDEKVVALVGAEKKDELDKVLAASQDDMRQLMGERPKAFDKMDEDIRKVLSDEQWKQYQSLQAARRGGRGDGTHRGPGGRGSPGAATRPATTRPGATMY